MLESTLTASPTAGGVELAYTVENTGDEPVTLSFSDGQRAEYVAERDGETVWQYSDGRMFAMALGSLELAPGQEETFTATWQDPPAGDYDLRAWLVADEATAEATTTVSLD